MSRGLDAALISALESGQVSTFRLLKLAFSSTTFYMTDYARDISYSGDNYISDGSIIEMGDIIEEITMGIPRVTLAFSGANSALISAILSESLINRDATIHVGCIDVTDGTIIDTPILIFEGFMDEPTVSEDENYNAEVQIICTSHWANFEQKNGRHTNDSEQQALFSGDKGFEFASKVLDTIYWGRDSPLKEPLDVPASIAVANKRIGRNWI